MVAYKKIPDKSSIVWLINVIRDLAQAKFYGELTIKFKDGGIIKAEQRVDLVPPRG